MKKLLCVVGPTATGKTKLAVRLAQALGGSLISADSRQVYRGMDIVTGKDHPGETALAGIDFVNPDEPCSVSLWHHAVTPVLSHPLPLVVGGTGLYVKSLTHPFETMSVKPDPELRQELARLSVSELQSRLGKLASQKLASMNHSDASNPRRLIRAIEVAMGSDSHLPASPSPTTLLIGLRYFDNSNYDSNVEQRVKERLAAGAIEETQRLLESYSPDLPSMTAIGYRSIIKYLAGELSRDELIVQWTHDELAYAKRQLTWFAKVAGIHWFDPSVEGVGDQVEELASSWYYKNHD